MAVEEYPDHIQAVLDTLTAKQKRVEETTAARDAALLERRNALRDSYDMLKRAGVGPSAIERATGIGKSNVRILTTGM